MYIYTIQQDDVNNNHLLIGNHWYSLVDSIGYVQAIDVGKRVYLSEWDDTITVENNQQRDKRLRKEETR